MEWSSDMSGMLCEKGVRLRPTASGGPESMLENPDAAGCMCACAPDGATIIGGGGGGGGGRMAEWWCRWWCCACASCCCAMDGAWCGGMGGGRPAWKK